MNSVPSFHGFHITDKGRESLKSKPTSFIEEDLLPTAEQAKKDEKNGLYIEDDGRIYIETPEDGKFTINNPSIPEVNGQTFSCNVRTPENEVKRVYIQFKDANEAKKFEHHNFFGGAYIPKMNLDLYKAIAAADTYKQSLIDKL